MKLFKEIAHTNTAPTRRVNLLCVSEAEKFINLLTAFTALCHENNSQAFGWAPLNQFVMIKTAFFSVQ
jgi:hypothetical protein